jgi:hypothetical protein
MYDCDRCGADATTTYYLDCGEIVHACTDACYRFLVEWDDAYHNGDAPTHQE